MQKIDGQQLSLLLESSQIEKIDKVAKRHGMTRAAVVRALLDVGIDTYDTFEMFGFPQVLGLAKKANRICKEVLERQKQPTLF